MTNHTPMPGLIRLLAVLMFVSVTVHADELENQMLEAQQAQASATQQIADAQQEQALDADINLIQSSSPCSFQAVQYPDGRMATMAWGDRRSVQVYVKVCNGNVQN